MIHGARRDAIARRAQPRSSECSLGCLRAVPAGLTVGCSVVHPTAEYVAAWANLAHDTCLLCRARECILHFVAEFSVRPAMLYEPCDK